MYVVLLINNILKSFNFILLRV